MVAVLNQTKRDHLSQRLEYFRRGQASTEKLLKSASKWPWKKREKGRLLSVLCGDLLKIATIELAIGDDDNSRMSFLRLADSLDEHRMTVSNVIPSVLHGRAVCGLLVTNSEERGQTLSGEYHSALRFLCSPNEVVDSPTSSEDQKTVSIRLNGLSALFGWIQGLREESAEEARMAIQKSPTDALREAFLWARCILSDFEGTDDQFHSDLNQMVEEIDRLRKSADPSFAEDVEVYTPAIVLARIAMRRGRAVKPNQSEILPERLLTVT